jgi:hypothetical protein
VDDTPIWNPGNLQQEFYQVTALASATIIRTDAMGCLPDTFNIVVHQNDTCGYLSFFNNEIESSSFDAYYLDGYLIIENFKADFNDFELYNINGQVVSSFHINKGIFKQNIQFLPQGTYFLKPQYIVKSKRINKND